MSSAQKDTIYIDVDDEITTIVDKVQNSSSKIVALVLPKRAVVLQSIVNMKLLKRAADDAGKRAVLITSESGLLPLAGAVGVYTAKNLQSKPEIPAPPDAPDEVDELLEDEDAPEEPEIDSTKPVGDLASDDEAVFESDIAGDANKSTKKSKTSKTKKTKKDRKNKVPNFDSFRKKVFIGIGAFVALMVLLYLAFFVVPKAIITVQTETSSTNETIDFTASPTAQTADFDKGILPSKEVQVKKTESVKTPATGEKDLGSKATGEINLTAPIGPDPITIASGTGVSTGNLTYITQKTVTLSPAFQGGSFKFVGSVGVTAQENGDKYNISSGKAFTVSGHNSVSGSNGSGFSGGSSKIAKVVSQQDIDNATQKLTDPTEAAKTELQKQLEDDGYYAIPETFAAISDIVAATPQVDQEANEVTVSSDKTFAMTGVKKDDLEKLVEHSVQEEVDKRKLQVQSSGIDKAVFRSGNRKDDGTTTLSMQTQVVLGPKIDTDALKQQIAGKKRGDVENIVKEIEGVKEVDVKYSPFWVSSTPKNVNKITIKYEEANSE